jgi:hypothetical protein
VNPGDLDANVVLGDVPAHAMRLGASEVKLVASGEAVEGERLGAFIDLPGDACVLAYARASSSIEDLDLAAFDDEGSPVAVDEGPDPKPTLLLCPAGAAGASRPGRVYLAAHVVNGEGLVGVAAQSVPRDRAAEVSRALGAHGGGAGATQPTDAWQGLDDHVRAHRQALGGTWDEFRRAAIVLDSRAPTLVTLPVEAGSCVDAVLVPGDEVALLEVEAVDGAGRVVARAREGGSDRTLTVCSPMTFEGSLVIRPHVGRGLAAIVLAKTRESASRDLTLKPDVLWEPTSVPIDAARTEREGALARAGYGGEAFSSKGDLAVGRRVTIPVDLGSRAECTRIDVIAGAPLSLVDAQVWSDEKSDRERERRRPAGADKTRDRDHESGRAPGSEKIDSTEKSELVTSGDGVWGTAVFACLQGKARLELEAHGRGGPFVVTARAEKWKDAAFAKYPLAAARMIARAADGPAVILDGVPSSARALELDPESRLTWSESVAANQCLQVSAGGEGEGTGLELRAFDATSGEELDRSHAARAVSVRVCADGTPRTARIELRTTSGKLGVIIGERSR